MHNLAQGGPYELVNIIHNDKNTLLVTRRTKAANCGIPAGPSLSGSCRRVRGLPANEQTGILPFPIWDSSPQLGSPTETNSYAL